MAGDAVPGLPGDALIVKRLDDGLVEGLVFDEGADAMHRVLSQDVEPLIEANKAAFNEGLINRRSEMRRVASFPPHARQLFTEMFGADPFANGNEKLLERILNDPDLARFRTLPGRVAVTEK